MNSHYDIVLVNVHDTYSNMIHKVGAALSWGSSSCGATYVARANDDVYLR